MPLLKVHTNLTFALFCDVDLTAGARWSTVWPLMAIGDIESVSLILQCVFKIAGELEGHGYQMTWTEMVD